MSEVLTQDEIDKLLTAISSGEEKDEEHKSVRDNRRIKIYDFKRPDVLSKEQIRFMANTVEDNLFSLTKLWKKVIPNIVHMHLASVDQLTFEEYIRSIPYPCYLMLGMSGKYPITLEVDPFGPKFFDPSLNTIFREDVPKADHTEWNKLSDVQIKKKIAADEKKKEEKKQQFLEDLRTGKKKIPEKSWADEFTKKVTGPMIRSFMTLIRNDLSKRIEEPRHFKTETNPHFIGSSYEETFKDRKDEMFFTPSGMTLLFTFEMMYDTGDECMITLCIPWKFAAEMIDKYNGTYDDKRDCKVFDSRFLKDIKVPVEVSLGKTHLSIEDLKEMGEGTVLTLDKLAGETVDIKVGDTVVAKGEVVVIDENFGVRICECAKREF